MVGKGRQKEEGREERHEGEAAMKQTNTERAGLQERGRERQPERELLGCRGGERGEAAAAAAAAEEEEEGDPGKKPRKQKHGDAATSNDPRIRPPSTASRWLPRR